MRGLDPRIHAVASVASGCCADVDGRIKSGHDDSELHKGHRAFGSVPTANSPDSRVAKAGIQGSKALAVALDPRFRGGDG